MNNKQIILGCGIILVAALAANGQPYYVAGSALTPAWSPGDPGNQMIEGPAGVFSLTTATTANAYHEFKVTGASWGDPNWPASNARISGDANGTNTFYFYPGVHGDGWTPVQDRVGYDDPGNMLWEIAGDFTTPNWDSDPNAQMHSAGNGVFTNTYVIATPGTHQFKFRTTGAWDKAQAGTDFGENPGNATVITTTANQAVLFQLDLPHGRWLAGTVQAPVTNRVVFAVDMSSQIQLGLFTPGSSVFVSGAFNGWPGTGAGALILTNDPPYLGGSNTNIYYGTNQFIGAPGTHATDYKFTDNDPNLPAGNNGYEPLSNNRSFNLMTTNGVLLLPVASFGDTFSSDYLPEDTYVTFRVNMNGAVTSTNSPAGINSPEGMNLPHAFDANAGDRVFINGNFFDNGWESTWNPLSSQQIQEDPPLSGIYSFTYLVKKGHPVEIHYKYGIGYSGYASTNHILDNEAATYQDHIRYIRTTAGGSYTNALDTFGNQHVEPSSPTDGHLALSAGPSGHVTLTWLGRPGVHVQSSTGLAGGSWVDALETDGTNWTAGSNSPDGLLSTTNWPVTPGGSRFFRLIKQ